ncbi:MAG: peptidase S10 [Candidatus Protochlamydia sp.]|nr:peptidase S10 [Candidatus Protochlamydia sp.]
MQKIWALLLFGLYLSSSLSGEEVKSEEKPRCELKEGYSETRHETVINGNPIAYKAVAGTFMLKDIKCEPTASLFFISYTKEGAENEQRPVTFCFNGGPGSSSVWLHLGTFGPKRVALSDKGDSLPPFHLIDNEFSILDQTDLVFIDPVSTGFSQAIPTDKAKSFHGVEEDIKSVAEFIRIYLTRFNRWNSPKFIAGESYGATRAAGLAGHLHDKYFINVNGIILISSILNFQSIDFNAGNDMSYIMFLPSYTATAWYHHMLAPDLQNAPLPEVLQEAREFVSGEYLMALFQGSQLSKENRALITQKLSRLTGLTPEYIARTNLRIDNMRYMKELLRNRNQTVGRFDSRILGMDADAAGEMFDYDPSMNAIFGAFTSTFNNYVKNDLKWETDNRYQILNNVQPWDYGSGNQCFNVADTLRSVMAKNFNLRVFVANGYFDLATPFFGTEYTFNHLGMDRALLNHVTMKYYEAGHMMYIYLPALKQLKVDLSHFYLNTLENQEREEGNK